MSEIKNAEQPPKFEITVKNFKPIADCQSQVSVDFSFNHSATCSTCPVSNERFAASVTARLFTASA